MTTKTEALASLQDLLKDGDTVYTILRSRSRTGMSRKLSLIAIHDNALIDLTYYVATALSLSVDADGGMIVRGYGMDHGADAVVHLADATGLSLNQRWL